MFPLKDTSSARIFPFWVTVIILINVYIFFLEITSFNPDALIIQYALIPARIDFITPQTLLPFVTAQFLHGGFLHIISNMWFLWVFGKNLEARITFLFPAFYLFTGVLGYILQHALFSESSIPILGASGAIAGVLGAYYALFPTHKIKTFIFVIFFAAVVDIPVSFMMFYWLITQLFSGAASAAVTAAGDSGGVAYFAHIGGFVGGWIIGKILALTSANTLVRET